MDRIITSPPPRSDSWGSDSSSGSIASSRDSMDDVDLNDTPTSTQSTPNSSTKTSLEKPRSTSALKTLGCRELVGRKYASETSIPSIHLHSATCVCNVEEKDLVKLDGRYQDRVLEAKIYAAIVAVRERKASQTQTQQVQASVTAAMQSMSLWFTSGQSTSLVGTAAGSDAAHKISELCFGCAALDIDKVQRLLFQENIPINARNQSGTSPLMAALRSPHIRSRPRAFFQMVHFLVEAGADVNAVMPAHGPKGKGTMTILATATSLGLTDVVSMLLDRGANINGQQTSIPMHKYGGHGLSALHVAVFAGRSETAKLLVRRGADVRATFDADRSVKFMNMESTPKAKRDRRHWTTGITALHLAEDDASCAIPLLARGADPSARDGWGRSPLHYAAAAGNAHVVDGLLAGGAEADARDEDGCTPLAFLCARVESGAARRGHPEVVKELLRAGADGGLQYPQDVSIRDRFLLMDEWREVYRPIFEIP